MSRRVPRTLAALAFLAASAALVPARGDSPPPAVLELILPPGATATADGKSLGNSRAFTLTDLKAVEARRVKVVVTFADGTTDERLVDVSAGQRIPVPVPLPGPEKAATIAAQPLTPINAAAVRGDGKYIAVGLESNAVVLWDTAAGRPVRTLAGHQKVVLTVAFSPDGKHLLSGSADATAVLWEVETGTRRRTYKGHTGSVVSAAFSPDGSRVITGSPDGTAILWETRTGERVHTLPSKEVLGVAYSPDGTTLATASSDTTAALWDAKTGKPNLVLRGHKEGVTSVAFSPDGTRVLTGSFENVGIVWEAATGKHVSTTGRHGNDVYSVAFTPDGRRALTGEREEVVMMWDAATGAHARTFAGHNADIVSIVPSGDGRTVLTGSRDGTARLWDLATGRELLALTTDAPRKAWAVVSPDGLFDASDAGRRVLAYRFTKLGAEIDQFFAGGYRPGLLAEVWRGGRPLPAKPLGRSKPPLVRLVAPKDRVLTTPAVTLAADVTDQGGGVSGFAVENNGVRLSLATKAEPTADGKATRVTFTVPLAPGVNKVRVRAATADGAWEAASTDIDLTRPRTPGERSRMYVVAVGVGPPAEKDAKVLAELLRDRGAKSHERVDVVPLFARDATRAAIEDTVKDVAELTRPHDTLVVLLCGPGAMIGDRLHFAPHDLRINPDRPEDALRARGVPVDGLAAALGTAPALRRVLVVDAAGTAFGGATKGRPEFGLRGTVERWARYHGVFALAAVAPTDQRPGPGRGPLAHALLAAADAGDQTTEPLDAADWLQAAAGRAGPHAQASTQPRGFPILAAGK